MSAELLRIQDLSVEFRGDRRHSTVTALDRVSLTISQGQTVGLVGESGSGKTTLALAILGLVRPTAGHIMFAGDDLAAVGRRPRRRLGRDLQVVFQDPYSSLNPARTVSQILSEPLDVHEDLPKDQVRRRITDMLGQVGLPADAAGQYPAEFSGGQRQRIAIARALMVSPRLVICDEPVSALDLSVQAQILNLLADIQRNLSVSFLLISHDLAVVRYLSSQVVVLYRGHVMESGPAEEICTRPSHPYTRALLAAVPSPDPGRAQRSAYNAPPSNGYASNGYASGKILPAAQREPKLADGLHGCPYFERCPISVERCRSDRPELRPVGGAATRAACHLLPDPAHGSDPTRMPAP
jgi:ABC-type glutathione transport system ATPase component